METNLKKFTIKREEIKTLRQSSSITIFAETLEEANLITSKKMTEVKDGYNGGFFDERSGEVIDIKINLTVEEVK